MVHEGKLILPAVTEEPIFAQLAVCEDVEAVPGPVLLDMDLRAVTGRFDVVTSAVRIAEIARALNAPT